MEKADVIEYSNENNTELELCFAGISQCAPGHSYGPAVRPTYLIHIILKGKGIFRQDETEYKLEASQGFLIVPDKITFYQADTENPWEYMWVGFRGSRALEILKELDLNSHHPVFSCEDVSLLKDLISQMMEIQGSHLSARLHRDSLILEFFSVLASKKHLESSKKDLSHGEYIRQAVSFIQANYDRPIKITDISAYVGIDRTYLYSLFTAHLKMTPTAYLKAYRLSRARELLKVTNLPIAQIAESVGYRDPLVFTKAFRQEYGLTPSAWRKTKKTSHSKV